MPLRPVARQPRLVHGGTAVSLRRDTAWRPAKHPWGRTDRGGRPAGTPGKSGIPDMRAERFLFGTRAKGACLSTGYRTPRDAKRIHASSTTEHASSRRRDAAARTRTAAAGKGGLQGAGGGKYPAHPQAAGLQARADGGVEHCHRAGTAALQRLPPARRDGGERIRAPSARGAALRARDQCLRTQLGLFAAGAAVPPGPAVARLAGGRDRRKRPPRRAARPRCALHRGGAGEEPALPRDRRRGPAARATSPPAGGRSSRRCRSRRSGRCTRTRPPSLPGTRPSRPS